jgi:membrane carboxypeptidase/penicillin-binding protein
VHWELFLKFCRSFGAESTEIPEVAGLVLGVVAGRRLEMAQTYFDTKT